MVNIWLSVVGSVASIVGLVMTYVIWLGVKNLKTFYVAKATIPQQLSELEVMRDKIEEHLNGRFDGTKRERIHEYSVEAQVNIQNLCPKLRDVDESMFSSQIEPKAIAFNQAVAAFGVSQTKENARTVSRELLQFKRSAEFVLNDDNWRRIQ